MCSMENVKPHAVLVPFPAQGHITPMMRLAILLHSRGFHITFVNTEFNHRRLIRSKGPESVKGLQDFRFETIPDGLPPSDQDSTQDVIPLCDSTRKNCLVPFKQLLVKLNSSHDVPPVTCVVSDGVMSFGIKAAGDLGIPQVQFWTASVCSFIGYLHYRELIKRGMVPFKDEKYQTDGTLNTPIDWVSGMPNIRLKDLPSFLRTSDPNDILFDFLGEEAQNCLNSSTIIFNTFDEFEHDAIQALLSKFNYSNIYTIGPLHLLENNLLQNDAKSISSSLWKPDSAVFDWLGKREENSVVYVNYGSVTTMTDQHFKEFAWGLAYSKQSFLWIIRSDIVKGESAMLPDEFLDEVKDRGLVVSWCDQEKVLEHPAVGAFLSHCGWNSMMEIVSAGVPVIGWPFFADQQTNCHYSCEKWGVGMEIDHDVRRDEVAKMVGEMMEGGRGEGMRRKAQEWKRIAEEVTMVGERSYCNFDRLIRDTLHHTLKN